MLRRLIQDIHLWAVHWRRRYALRTSLMTGSESAGYFLMFSLPVIVFGVIIFLALTSTEPRVLPPAQASLEFRRTLALRCLAENVYYEARGEPLKGQYAVAEVTLNRMRSKHFPDSVCKVVHESRFDRIRRRFVAHFSWTDDGRGSEPVGPAWDQAMKVAAAVYDNTQEPVVPGALFYHARYVHPAWAKSKKPLATIGNHIFYE